MVNNYKILITKQAKKDVEKINQQPALKKKVEHLIELVKEDPFKTPPNYEGLIGDLKGLYSRRINKQHRFVYRVEENEKVVIIVSMWTHYENI